VPVGTVLFSARISMPPAPSHSCRPALAASAISPSVWCACRLSRARSPWSDHAGSARKARSALRVSASYWPAGRTRCARNGVQGDVPQASRISGCRQVCAVRLAAPVCGRARVKKSQAGSAGRVPGDVTVSEDEHVEVWEPRAGPFLTTLRCAGFVHHAKADSLDLRTSHHWEPLPEGAMVVVAPHGDEAAGSRLEFVQRRSSIQSPAWITRSALSISLHTWPGRSRGALREVCPPPIPTASP
jgi:hypothetical protein